MSKTRDNLLDQLPDGVLVIGNNLTVHYVNGAAESILEQSATRIIGQKADGLFRQAPVWRELLKEVFSSPKNLMRTVIEYPSATGAPRNIEIVLTSLAGGDAIFCLRDRSWIKNLEAGAQRSDELSRLETIASGIAHEIKNPLGGMRGAVQLLARELGDHGSFQEYIDVMLREIDRVTAIVDTLKDLANPPPPRKVAPVDLNQLLSEIVLLQETNSTISFDLQLDTSLPPLYGDPDGLQQAFLNLVGNAMEAIQGCDKATIRLVTALETGISYKDPQGRKCPLVRIEVADNGPGIPQENLDQIFAPFYTTKAKGTGLGLATTQRIFASHQGQITVESQEGAGSMFTVRLPVQEPKVKELS